MVPGTRLSIRLAGGLAATLPDTSHEVFNGGRNKSPGNTLRILPQIYLEASRKKYPNHRTVD
jgi:hypothetical protein